jgi:acetyl-CoA acetyltransferase
MPMLRRAKEVGHLARSAGEYCWNQRRTAEAQRAGRFDAEIVPIIATMAVKDKATGAVSHRTVTLEQDEGNRPDTTLAGLAALKPVIEGGVVTAGNASQLSDGSAACVLMHERLASQRGGSRSAAISGIAVAGCAPKWVLDRLCGPEAAPAARPEIGDVGLWELNEAFAVQVLLPRLPRSTLPG